MPRTSAAARAATSRRSPEPSADAAVSGALSEFEYGLVIAGNAFQRWVARCMRAAGDRRLTALDTLVLVTVDLRARDKKLADICFVLNVEDSHIVSYALRKLTGFGLVTSARQGKERLYATTAAGHALCERYRAIRHDCLVDAVGHLGAGGRELGEVAPLLRALSGLYDQAARRAATEI